MEKSFSTEFFKENNKNFEKQISPFERAPPNYQTENSNFSKQAFYSSNNMPKTSYNKFSPNLEKSSRVNKRKLVFLPQKNTQKILQKILKDVGLSESDIIMILKRWKGKKSFQDKPRKGRPRVLSTSSRIYYWKTSYIFFSINS